LPSNQLVRPILNETDAPQTDARDRRVGFFPVLKRRKTEKDDAETDDRFSTHSVRPTKPFVGLAVGIPHIFTLVTAAGAARNIPPGFSSSSLNVPYGKSLILASPHN
jgi:hypothetical protein